MTRVVSRTEDYCRGAGLELPGAEPAGRRQWGGRRGGGCGPSIAAEGGGLGCPGGDLHKNAARRAANQGVSGRAQGGAWDMAHAMGDGTGAAAWDCACCRVLQNPPPVPFA